jgi:hypothetical protein
MANQNGLAGQNAGGFNNINAPAAIPAGFYADMQFLDRNMDSLTLALNENRNEWNQLEDLLARASRLNVRFCVPERAQVHYVETIDTHSFLDQTKRWRWTIDQW